MATIEVRPGDPTQRLPASLHTDVLEREHVGEGITVRESPYPVSVGKHFGDLEAAAPLSEVSVADVDGDTHIEPRRRSSTLGGTRIDSVGRGGPRFTRRRCSRAFDYGRDAGSQWTVDAGSVVDVGSSIRRSALVSERLGSARSPKGRVVWG